MSDTILETPSKEDALEVISNEPLEPKDVSTEPIAKDAVRVHVLALDRIFETDDNAPEGIMFKKSFKVTKCEGPAEYVSATQFAGQMRRTTNKVELLDEIFEYKLAAQILKEEKDANISGKRRILVVDVTEFPYISTHVDYRDQEEVLKSSLNDEKFVEEVLKYWNADGCKERWCCAMFVNQHINRVTFRLLNGCIEGLFNLYTLDDQ